MRLGTVGYLCNTGLGCQTQDYRKNLPIESHYVVPQPNIGIDMKGIDPKCVLPNQKVSIESWLENLDAVIVIETPYIENLFPLCKKMNRKVICTVNIDWFAPDLHERWWQYVDTFIAPNLYTLKLLEAYGYKNVHYVPCSVDTELLQFKQRTKVSTFLFNNGWGGVNNRKGHREVIMLQYATLIPLIFNSQANLSVGGINLKVNIMNRPLRQDLYSEGDVYLSPSKWEGHGVHILEAMACGIPVIVTDYEPMNEYVINPDYKIKVKRVEFIKSGRLNTASSTIDFDDFKSKVVSKLDSDITLESSTVREFVEKKHSYKVNVDKFMAVIEGKVS